MMTFTSDQWVILGLTFALGLFVGMWLTSGGRRKWKNRYTEEMDKRHALEKTHQEREAHWTTREKEWREQDSLHAAATRGQVADRPVGGSSYSDRDGDGFRDRPMGDRDGDGYRDRPLGDRDGDGYRDRPVMGGHRPGDVDGDGIPNRGDRHPADRDRY
jgi:hypothetical protein